MSNVTESGARALLRPWTLDLGHWTKPYSRDPGIDRSFFRVGLFLVAGGHRVGDVLEHRVGAAVGDRLVGVEPLVALAVPRDRLVVLAGVVDHELVHPLAGADHLLGL